MAEWTTHKSDFHRSGYTTNAPPRGLELQDSKFLESGWMFSTPLVKNDNIYAITYSDDGKIWRLNLDLSVISYDRIGYSRCTPTIKGNYIYFGTGTSTWISSSLLRYDLNNISRESRKRYVLPQASESSPVVANGYVYFGIGGGSGNSWVYQLDENFNLIARIQTNHNVRAGIIANLNYIYVLDNIGTLYQLDALNISNIIATTVVGIGSFVGTRHGATPCLDFDGNYLYAFAPAGMLNSKVYKLDASNITIEIASREFPGNLQDPVIDETHLYISSQERFYKLKKSDLSEVSSFLIPTSSSTYYTITKDYIFLVNYKTIYQLDKNLNLISSYSVAGRISHPPSVVDGFVYVNDMNGTIYKFGLVEGFLDITGITAPTTAHTGDLINFIVHTKNTSATDKFKVELSGDLTASQEFSLGLGLTQDVPFSFTMPATDISIIIKTYHQTEEGDWVWDATSVWGVNRWN